MIRIEPGIHETIDGRKFFLPQGIIARGWEDMNEQERAEIKAELAKRKGEAN